MYKLRHPRDPCRWAKYGGDLEGGVKLLIYMGAAQSVLIRYDRRSPEYDANSPAQGLLNMLVMHGFFDPSEFEAGFHGLAQGQLRHGRAPRQVKRAAKVIRSLGELLGWG